MDNQVKPFEGAEHGHFRKPDVRKIALPGGTKSSNDIDMIAGEKEVWASWMTPTSGFKRNPVASLVNVFSCCKASDDTCLAMSEILLTNKRLVFRDFMHHKSPGQKYCCYYVQCLCCCPSERMVDEEDETIIEVEDIRGFEIGIRQEKMTSGGCCATFSEKTAVTLGLSLVKKVGVYQPSSPNQKWTFEPDNKTSWVRMETGGFMEPNAAAEFRRQLATVVAANVDAAVVPTTRTLTNAL